MNIILILSLFILLLIIPCTSYWASNSNTINRLLRISENEPRFKKRVACLWVLQYVGFIVMSFALIAEHGTFFGYQISVDRVIWLIILLAGATAMFVGYYERKMIQVVRAIKDIE